MPTYQLELISRRTAGACMRIIPLLVEQKSPGKQTGRIYLAYICGACGVILHGPQDTGIDIHDMIIECGICNARNVMWGKNVRTNIDEMFFPILPREYSIKRLLIKIRSIAKQI